MPKKKQSESSGKKTRGSGKQRSPSVRQIKKLDREILGLLNQRADLAVKRVQAGGSDNCQQALHDAEALGEIAGLNQGPLSDDSVRAVFRELFSGCHSIGQPVRVSFLGPEYTYSHLAAIERFGQSADLAPVGSIASVFEEVERGHSQFGIVPIENSTDGRVVDALVCLAHSSAKICGEVLLRIRHCLLGLGTRAEVARILSKPQAISQCRDWLAKHMPHAQLVEVASTSEAARQASLDPQTAAIASHQAGSNHLLSVLARNIEDNPDNVTRFVVIGLQSGEKTGNDKTSLVFEVDHQPGALADAMGIFKRQKLNLTWIESFPVPSQRGRYLFFVEFQGHASELRVRRALTSLEKKSLRLGVLGSYAQAEPIG